MSWKNVFHGMAIFIGLVFLVSIAAVALSESEWVKGNKKAEAERRISQARKNLKKTAIIYTRDSNTSLCFAWAHIPHVSAAAIAHVPCDAKVLEQVNK